MVQRLLSRKRAPQNATTLHEANFKKLARVVPGLHTFEESTSVQGQGGTRLSLQMLEVSKYTKTFSLHLQQSTEHPWLPALHMKIRNYYDAGVTEVLAFQYRHRLDARYPYPNSNMFQPNEKWQNNQFLGEWLDHCLRTRCIFHQEPESLDG